MGPASSTKSQRLRRKRIKPSVYKPPVHKTPTRWERINKLKKYAGIIRSNRAPALFKKKDGLPVFAGCIYAYKANGTRGKRRVYMDSSVPTKPTMHVARTRKDEDVVVTNYIWSLVNFVFQEAEKYRPEKTVRKFRLYSVGMVDTWGLCWEKTQAVFKPMKEKGNFPVLQIKEGLEVDHITDEDGKLGLYVDKDWTVKVTGDDSLWNKFSIAGFTPCLAYDQK